MFCPATQARVFPGDPGPAAIFPCVLLHWLAGCRIRPLLWALPSVGTCLCWRMFWNCGLFFLWLCVQGRRPVYYQVPEMNPLAP